MKKPHNRILTILAAAAMLLGVALTGLGHNLSDGTTYAMCDGSDLIYTIDTPIAKLLSEATDESVLPS